MRSSQGRTYARNLFTNSLWFCMTTIRPMYTSTTSMNAQKSKSTRMSRGEPQSLLKYFRYQTTDFPDIEIKKTDAIVYGLRTEWRFSLYFDFRRSVDTDKLALELGALKKEATF